MHNRPTVRQRHLYDSFAIGELSAVRLAMGGIVIALETAHSLKWRYTESGWVCEVCTARG